MEEITAKIRKIAEYYGYEAQSNQLVEECAELIQAVNKFQRVRGLGQPISSGIMEVKCNLIEEITDVLIMLEQIKYLLSIEDGKIKEVMLYKLDRTINRIKSQKEG